MNILCFRPPRGRAVRAWLAASALLAGMGASTIAPAQSSGGYTLSWSSIAAGGVVRLRSPCYQLAGSITFLSPGAVSGGVYTIFTGFWVAAPIANQDEIFFNGFEECN